MQSNCDRRCFSVYDRISTKLFSINMKRIKQCCVCQQFSEVAYSRVRPIDNQFIFSHWCEQCSPEMEPRPIQSSKTKFNVTVLPRNPVSPVASQQSPTKSFRKSRSRGKQLKPVEPRETQKLNNGLRLYYVRHTQGGGIVPDESLSRRLSQHGTFAVQIAGTSNFQLIGNLSGVIECKLQTPARAIFTTPNPKIHEVING